MSKEFKINGNAQNNFSELPFATKFWKCFGVLLTISGNDTKQALELLLKLSGNGEANQGINLLEG